MDKKHNSLGILYSRDPEPEKNYLLKPQSELRKTYSLKLEPEPGKIICLSQSRFLTPALTLVRSLQPPHLSFLALDLPTGPSTLPPHLKNYEGWSENHSFGGATTGAGNIGNFLPELEPDKNYFLKKEPELESSRN